MTGRTAICAAILLLATPALADDDGYLDRIPIGAPSLETQSPAPNRTLYLQNDFALYSVRSSLAVPPPPSQSASWEARLFLDARSEWTLGGSISLTYSGRLNFRAEDDLPFPNHENIRHDLREAYLTWQADDGTYLQLGRINLKSGVALGYNPTDFFRTRAVVEPLSADPSILREDRLGTLMLLGQHVWDGFALTVALAPKIKRSSAFYSNIDLPSFDPMFDRTNAQTRLFAKASMTLAGNFNPEVLFYSAGGRNSFGLNVTRSFGKSVVGYVEWSGGNSSTLVHDAEHFGIVAGSLPVAALGIISQHADRSFHNDISVGVSYATEEEITFNLEYHYHAAGFSDADWKGWFEAGKVGDDSVRGVLWFIRGYAADRQEPVTRSNIFLRADWQDAMVHDLDLTGFVEADTRDGSGIAQISADYYVSRDWTIGALADLTFGRRCSDFGSIPESANYLVKVTHYL